MKKEIPIGRKWLINKNKACKVKEILIEKGGKEKKVNSSYEIWRIKLKDAIFTYYQTKTLYSTPTRNKEPDVLSCWEEIKKIALPLFIPLKKEFALGLDETNKGEVFGPLFLVGIFLPKELFPLLEEFISSIDTKKNHKFSYWQRIFKKILFFQKGGLHFIGKKISPKLIDKYKINYLMDLGYLSILKKITNDKELKNLRITIDDYGIGENLKIFLTNLAKKGAEIIVKKNADEKFLEVKTAAIIAKYLKEEFFYQIKNDPKYQIDNLTIGSGNLGDQETKEWLNQWYEKYHNFPWFVRKSYALVKKILDIQEKIKKMPHK